jgi:hypothetical protein
MLRTQTRGQRQVAILRRTGTALSPLHDGHCPPWLFAEMKRLGTAMVEAMVVEFGTAEVLRRFSDPVWFQAFGAVLGFDWHSSGLTTVLLGALKEGLAERMRDLGLVVAGGKGKAARKTPDDIERAVERLAAGLDPQGLVRASRLSAKVDSALVQDGHTLYHHVFLFDRTGRWAVVQQGMNPERRTARRYHWLGEGVVSFVAEPHAAVVGVPGEPALDLTAAANAPVRDRSVALVREPPTKVLAEWRRLKGEIELRLPAAHPIPSAAHLDRTLHRLYEADPRDYEALVAEPGVGAAALRALAMVAEVVFGVEATFRDPVRYAFAHGGKDGHPFPVDRDAYRRTVATLEAAIRRAAVGDRSRLDLLRRLSTVASRRARPE